MTHSDQQLIEKHLKLKEFISKRTEELEAELKDYKNGMKVIENVLFERLNERGAQNTKTDSGTAYLSEIMTPTVVDRTAFLAYCLDNWDTFGSDALDIGVIKKPVRQWLDEHNPNSKNHHDEKPPPGLEVTYYTNVNIRRT